MKLYICHFLNETREFRDSTTGDEDVLMEVSHQLESVLFQAANAEQAMNWCLRVMASYKDEDDEGKYDLRKFRYIGIYNLDNTHSSLAEMTDDLANNIGFTVDSIDMENIDIEKYSGTPNKARLALFQ